MSDAEPIDLDSFAAEYFRMWRALRDDAPQEERGWLETTDADPASRVDYLDWKSPLEAWPLILALVERAPSDEALAFVAAGPIEDLIRIHGTFSDRIAAEASVNPRFREALNYVWGWNEFPERVRSSLMPLLAPEVRRSWERLNETPRKRRWRPPQPPPRSKRT